MSKYPMKMRPVFKDYIWGGDQLVSKYGKQANMKPVAESWEISCHSDGPSIVANGDFAGSTLASVLKGNPSYIADTAEPQFPVLIKLIDAKQDLSVQVHPDDSYARLHKNDNGKNEMWYVVEAKPGATLIAGCRYSVSREELERRISDGSLIEIANIIPVQSGDCICIPAGMLHSIGKGIVIAEVQQSSNITYRVYDYDRIDADGKPRQLHIRQALEVVDTSLMGKKTVTDVVQLGTAIQLTDWPFFTSMLYIINQTEHLYCYHDSFHTILALDQMKIQWEEGFLSINAGECVFIPAGLGEYTIWGTGRILLTRL